jgi:hypothetical protein
LQLLKTNSFHVLHFVHSVENKVGQMENHEPRLTCERKMQALAKHSGANERAAGVNEGRAVISGDWSRFVLEGRPS